MIQLITETKETTRKSLGQTQNRLPHALNYRNGDQHNQFDRVPNPTAQLGCAGGIGAWRSACKFHCTKIFKNSPFLQRHSLRHADELSKDLDDLKKQLGQFHKERSYHVDKMHT